MNRADAEKQLWAGFRRAVRERDYDPLKIGRAHV